MEEWEIEVYEYAQHHHKGQKDKADKDYFLEHILHVVSILKMCLAGNEDYSKSDKRTLITACYLHDILEDTPVSDAQIIRIFGLEIYNLISEVTSRDNEPKNCFPRLKTLDGYLIKYADRLSNLSKRHGMSKEHKKDYMQRSVFWKEEVIGMPKGKVIITNEEIIDWILDQIIVNTKPEDELLDGTPFPSIEVETDHEYVENLILELDSAKDGTIREQIDDLRRTDEVDKGKKKLVTILIRFMY